MFSPFHFRLPDQRGRESIKFSAFGIQLFQLSAHQRQLDIVGAGQVHTLVLIHKKYLDSNRESEHNRCNKTHAKEQTF